MKIKNFNLGKSLQMLITKIIYICKFCNFFLPFFRVFSARCILFTYVNRNCSTKNPYILNSLKTNYLCI